MLHFAWHFPQNTHSYINLTIPVPSPQSPGPPRLSLFPYNAKRLKSFDLSLSCGRWDLNPHDVTTTRSLVLLVCQFRHFRVSGVSRFCISHRRVLLYHSSFCLASTFLNFFYFFNNIFFLLNLYYILSHCITEIR